MRGNASLGARCFFVSPLAPFGKERLNYRRAFGCEHAESDFHLVVEPGVGQDLEASAYRPALWVIRAVDQPRNARLNHCARAHTARLNGYIESRLCKPVIAENPCGFAQNNDFGVRRRVAIPDGAVPRARDDSAFVHQHRSDRHFSGVSRRTVSKSFLVLRSRDEERLDAEAIPYRVLDRRPWLQESWLQASLRPDVYPLQSLSLVALEPSTRTLPVSRGERGCDRPDGFRYISDPR